MMTRKSSAEKTVRDIRRATRKHYSSEEKIRIVLEGLRGEESVAELCRREGISSPFSCVSRTPAKICSFIEAVCFSISCEDNAES